MNQTATIISKETKMKLHHLLVPLTILLSFVTMLSAQTVDQRTIDQSQVLIKLSDNQGVNPGLTDIDKVVGEEVCFTLTAKDKNGNVIRDWNRKGQATTLTLKGSTANTDSSTQSWNDDPEGFSFARIMHNGVELVTISANEWSIPASAFDDNGQARICLIHTKAERGVTIGVTPTLVGLTQETPKINFSASTTTNFLVELTSQTSAGNQVFHMRPYEIVISPRDRYLNVTDETIRSRFSARFPGEFDSNQPGLADIFSGEVFITGVTNYLIASRISREIAQNDQLQWVMCFAVTDQNVRGRTNEYEILTHAPVPFNLISPVDQYILILSASSQLQMFSWERPTPPDPYTNIIVSRFGNPNPVSDVVTYTWTILDSISLTRAVNIASDNQGSLEKLTLTEGQIQSIMKQITGQPDVLQSGFVWYVEATDGLYKTLSSPPNMDANNRPGHRLTIINFPTSVKSTAIPSRLTLGQNYPNPFNPSTTISFGIPSSGHVSIKVFDLVGKHVGTVVNERLDAGEHTVSFNASRLPSGTYVYKLEFGGTTLTKRMTLLK